MGSITKQGRSHVFKVGGPIIWSMLLYRTKYGWYTQFRALLRKSWGGPSNFFEGGGVREPSPTPGGCALVNKLPNHADLPDVTREMTDPRRQATTPMKHGGNIPWLCVMDRTS